ncbi:MAG: TetR/AcrR family transcriptional regulator [Actinomycetota bacterium]|nr:TetR/AcrR family transcriptional regulator [Actinomycetota bacterium]
MPRWKRSKRRPDGPEADARRAERRRELLEAADRVVRRDGPAASMDVIAAEAGIAKPILYRHFGDKGGLYLALAERYVDEIMSVLRASWTEGVEPRARLAATIDAYLGFIEKEREAYRFLMHRAVTERPEAQATVSEFLRHVAGEVSVLVGDELRRFDLDSGAAAPWAHGLVGMVHLAGDWWLEHQTMSRAALAEYLTTLLWRGFSGLEGGVAVTQLEPERQLPGGR